MNLCCSDIYLMKNRKRYANLPKAAEKTHVNSKGRVNLLHCSWGEQTARLPADRPIVIS